MLRPRPESDESQGSFDEASGRLFKVSSGDVEEVPLTGSAIGWSRDGQIVQVANDTVSVCDATDCVVSQVDVGRGADLRLSGSICES